MESLDDGCLLAIFKLVNLNDRAGLRLASKRFQRLCDSIPINKLVVFERMAVETGQLEHTNEQYAYEHTARCFDLAKLFKNPVLLKQMEHLRVLAITGTRLPATQFDLTKFDELSYLSLNQVLLDSSTVLESPKLRYLILDHAYVKTDDEPNVKIAHLGLFGQMFGSETISVQAFGLNHLKSTSLKYLKLRGNRPLKFDFFNYCARNKLFDSLKELDVVIDDMRSIPLLGERCPNLKVLNAITWNVKFSEMIRNDVPDFFARIKNLKVYFFGIEFTQRSVQTVIYFLLEFQRIINQFNAARGYPSQLNTVECPINEKMLETIKLMAELYDLSRFYRVISQVQFRLPCGEFLKEAAFFRKLVNCETLYFDMDAYPEADLMKYFNYFAKLRCVRIEVHGLRNYHMSNALLKQLPKRCPRIQVFMLETKAKNTNFEFLLKFQQLSTIILNTEFAFDPAIYVKLMLKLKKTLFRLDVRYVVPSNVDRDQLRSFKQRVVSRLKERPDSDKLDFKLNIHTKNCKVDGDLTFVRCHLKPKELDCIVGDDEKLYHWARLVRKQADGFLVTLRMPQPVKPLF